LLCDKSDGGKQFHHYLDNDISHRCCRGRRREFGIDIKAAQEVSDGFEEVDERVAARADILDRLIYLSMKRNICIEAESVIPGEG